MVPLSSAKGVTPPGMLLGGGGGGLNGRMFWPSLPAPRWPQVGSSAVPAPKVQQRHRQRLWGGTGGCVTPLGLGDDDNDAALGEAQLRSSGERGANPKITWCI